MKNIYDFWRLSEEEQNALLGTQLTLENETFTVVEFDPASIRYREKYGLVEITIKTRHDGRRNACVYVPTVDDGATIYYWSSASFPTVFEFLTQYLERSNYYFSIGLLYSNRYLIGSSFEDDSY